MAPRELQQDGFDVLAGTESVDAEIRTGAGELARGEIADLGAIAHPARRAHLEIREDRLRRIEVRYEVAFLACAQPAPGEFVGIGGAPVCRGRQWRGRFAGSGCA